MQPAAPSSPYRQQAGGFGGGGGGFGSTMAASNPYASSAAPVPGRSPVGEGMAYVCVHACVCVCVCACVCVRVCASLGFVQMLCVTFTCS